MGFKTKSNAVIKRICVVFIGAKPMSHDKVSSIFQFSWIEEVYYQFKKTFKKYFFVEFMRIQQENLFRTYTGVS